MQIVLSRLYSTCLVAGLLFPSVGPPARAAAIDTETCATDAGRPVDPDLCVSIRRMNEKARHDAANLEQCLDGDGHPLGPRCDILQRTMKRANEQLQAAQRETEARKQEREAFQVRDMARQAEKAKAADEQRQAEEKQAAEQRVWLSQSPTVDEIKMALDSAKRCVELADEAISREREIGRESGFVNSQTLYSASQMKLNCKQRIASLQRCAASNTCRRPV